MNGNSRSKCAVTRRQGRCRTAPARCIGCQRCCCLLSLPSFVRVVYASPDACLCVFPACLCSTACTPLAHKEVPLRQRVKCITGVRCRSDCGLSCYICMLLGLLGFAWGYPVLPVKRFPGSLLCPVHVLLHRPSGALHGSVSFSLVADQHGYAIYFSRGVLPSNKDGEVRCVSGRGWAMTCIARRVSRAGSADNDCAAAPSPALIDASTAPPACVAAVALHFV